MVEGVDQVEQVEDQHRVLREQLKRGKLKIFMKTISEQIINEGIDQIEWEKMSQIDIVTKVEEANELDLG